MIWNARPRGSAGSALDRRIDVWVERGENQALPGQNAFTDYRPHIAPDQVIVEAAGDGSAIYIYAQGSTPTG